MFGNRLKAAREAKGLTMDELVKQYKNKFPDTGLNKGTLSKYENGKQEPMVSTVDKLSNILGVSVDYLLSGNSSERKEKSSDLTKKDERDISKKMQETLDQLESQQSGLMFDGEPMDDETKELLAISLKNSLELAKRIAKQKYTSKKYRKKSE